MTTYDPALCEECFARILTVEEEEEASHMTCDAVLLEGIETLIQIAYNNDLTDNAVDSVLMQIIDKRAGNIRKGFKIH